MDVNGRAVLSPTVLNALQVILHRDRVQRHLLQLREHCCQAMSHLLSANCDVGLGHAIHMGYDIDVSVRLAFTEVRLCLFGCETDRERESQREKERERASERERE
jgi:hypothetical protein